MNNLDGAVELILVNDGSKDSSLKLLRELHKADCTSMWSINKVYEPLHMQWMGIWNHWQLVTTALVDPDFDSRLNSWVTAGLQTIPLCSGSGSIPIQSCFHINMKYGLYFDIKKYIYLSCETVP